MNSNIRARKVALRRQLSAENDRHPPGERRHASEQICAALERLPEWRQATAVLLFVPMPSEPNIEPLLQAALLAGKTVTLPRYVPSQKCYEAGQIGDLQSDLQAGHFGIREPGRHCPLFALNRLDFVLVPGLGFDPQGLRLGRGKGYYDRLLAQVRGVTCGVAFDWQVVPEVPAEPHDIRLNCILTPTRRYSVARSVRF